MNMRITKCLIPKKQTKKHKKRKRNENVLQKTKTYYGIMYKQFDMHAYILRGETRELQKFENNKGTYKRFSISANPQSPRSIEAKKC